MTIDRLKDSTASFVIAGGFLVFLIAAGAWLYRELDDGGNQELFIACLGLIPLLLVAAMFEHDWRRYGTGGGAYLLLVTLYSSLALIGLGASFYGLENECSDTALLMALTCTAAVFYLLTVTALMRARDVDDLETYSIPHMEGHYFELRTSWFRKRTVNWK